MLSALLVTHLMTATSSFSVSLTILPPMPKPVVQQVTLTQLPKTQWPSMYQVKTLDEVKNVRVVRITY